MMDRSLIVILLLLLLGTGLAQAQSRALAPPVTSKKDTIANDIKTWRIDSRLGVADTLVIDTLVTSYQDNQPVNNYSIANSWNGNLGSPLESKIYFDRTSDVYDNMFARAYRPYSILADDVRFFNTKRPFSQLVYRSALPTYREEDYLKVLLTLNANKYVNVGGLCNFIYGRGQYQSQSSQMLTGGFWTSYTGKRYELNSTVMFNSFKNKENGGIVDNRYITDTESIIGTSNIAANNIPVNMDNTQSSYRNFVYFFNHRYNIGREIERVSDKDSSIIKEFQPIISITHTFKAEDVRRKYIEKDSIKNNFYAVNYYSGRYSADSTAFWSIKNTIAVTLNEKFNRKMKFGLAAYVDYDVRHYGVGYDTITVSKNTYHNLSVGAVLSKNEGRYFKYNVNGEIYLLGPYIGDFKAEGDFRGYFNIVSEPMTLQASGGIKGYSTYKLYDKYYSNHFKWDNPDFKKIISIDVKGRIGLPKRDISLGVQFRNIANYVYLDKNCLPSQHDGSIQVLSVDLAANLKAWRFHLDTKAVYQLTGNRDVLPLPDFAVYGNLYYMDKFFKVLTVQLGVSVRYHTAYYANAYMPALGQFYLQDKVLIGNYPEMNVYANFHLKTVRFFVQYYHFNKGLFGINNYLSMPGYPINPATFQFGLSWNFWN